MQTENKTSSYPNFHLFSKIGLAAGFGMFGGVQLFTGYWVLGLVSCGLGVVFAHDSIKLYSQPNSKLDPTPETKPIVNPDPQATQPNTGNDTSLKPANTSDKKQKRQSDPRHKPVPTLKLPTLGSTGYTPLAAAESRGSTPGSGGLSRKKNPNRLSQKPTYKEMETVRAMTEEELDELASQPSPKQTDRKQTTTKISKK